MRYRRHGANLSDCASCLEMHLRTNFVIVSVMSQRRWEGFHKIKFLYSVVEPQRVLSP